MFPESQTSLFAWAGGNCVTMRSKRIVVEMLLVVLTVAAGPCAFSNAAGGTVKKLGSGTTYHIWLPAEADPNIRYLLVVACHRFGGNGGFVGKYVRALQDLNCPVIVVAPTFPWSDTTIQLISDGIILKGVQVQKEVEAALAREWLFHPQVCMLGLGCGAYYADHFLQKYPRQVLAFAAVGFPFEPKPKPRPKVKKIPILAACGTQDQYYANTKKWYEGLCSAGYSSVKCDWEEGVGHTITPEMMQLAVDLYAQAYQSGPGSRLQLGRVKHWRQEAAVLEQMNVAAISTAMKRLRKGTKDQNPERAQEAERFLKAIGDWAGERAVRSEVLFSFSPAQGMDLLNKMSVMFRGDPLGEGFKKREVDVGRDRKLLKEISLDRKFESMANAYYKMAERFKKPDEPKAVSLRQQFQRALGSFIKSNPNTMAAVRAQKMKEELEGFGVVPE